jgi:hypothetical protein
MTIAFVIPVLRSGESATDSRDAWSRGAWRRTPPTADPLENERRLRIESIDEDRILGVLSLDSADSYYPRLEAIGKNGIVAGRQSRNAAARRDFGPLTSSLFFLILGQPARLPGIASRAGGVHG